MVDITKGFDFTDGVTDQCNEANLEALVDSATGSNVAHTDFSALAAPNHVTGTAPTASTREGSWWYDTGDQLWKNRVNGNWSDRLNLAEYENGSGAQINEGSVVTVGGAGTIAPTATAAWPEVYGVATGDIAIGAKGTVRKFGLGKCLVKGPISPGDQLVASNVDGWAESSTTIDANGNFDMNIAFGQALYAQGAGATALATVMLWE